MWDVTSVLSERESRKRIGKDSLRSFIIIIIIITNGMLTGCPLKKIPAKILIAFKISLKASLFFLWIQHLSTALWVLYELKAQDVSPGFHSLLCRGKGANSVLSPSSTAPTRTCREMGQGKHPPHFLSSVGGGHRQA